MALAIYILELCNFHNCFFTYKYNRANDQKKRKTDKNTKQQKKRDIKLLIKCKFLL